MKKFLHNSNAYFIGRRNNINNDNDPLGLLGNDLMAWYRGDNTQVVGSNVNIWTDKSNYLNSTLDQTTDTLRPVLEPTGFNGKSCLNFTNSRWFQLPNFLQSSWNQASLVILYDLADRNFHWSATQTGSGSDPYWGTSSVFSFNSFLGEFRANRLSFNPPPNVINVIGQGALIITTGASGYRVFRNGDTTPLFTTTNDWGVTATPYIGRDNLGSKFMNGRIAEIQIVRRELTISEITSLFSYLKAFWNLTIY